MKDNWMLIVAAVIFFFIFIIIFRGCDGKGTVKDNQNKIDSLTAIVKFQDEEYWKMIDRFKIKEDSMSKIIAATKKKVDSVGRSYEKVSWYARLLVQRGDSLKAQLDTISFMNNCDDLAVEVIRLDSLARDYVSMYEILEYNLTDALWQKDSVINLQQVAYVNMKANFDSCAAQAVQINEQLKKALKQKKFNKTLTRILGGAVLVLSGIAITK